MALTEHLFYGYARATMTNKAEITQEQLRSIPLFRSLSDQQLASAAKLFKHVSHQEGDVLFEMGSVAEHFYLLVDGEMTLELPNDAHQLRGPAVIGELGALIGLERNSKAIVGPDAVLFSVSGKELRGLIKENPDFGIEFQLALLEVTADKINRDQRRLIDMRTNLIRTQKAMKKMRDFLLESQDTEISEPIHEMLDGQIKLNRRVNYRVKPPAKLEASAQIESNDYRVVEISRTHISFKSDTSTFSEKDRLSGVLNLSGLDIPFSGIVLRSIKGKTDIELDLLIDEYATLLEGYLTRVQMLDYLV